MKSLFRHENHFLRHAYGTTFFNFFFNFMSDFHVGDVQFGTYFRELTGIILLFFAPFYIFWRVILGGLSPNSLCNPQFCSVRGTFGCHFAGGDKLVSIVCCNYGNLAGLVLVLLLKITLKKHCAGWSELGRLPQDYCLLRVESHVRMVCAVCV